MLTLTKITNYLQSMKVASDADQDPWGNPVNGVHTRAFEDTLVSLDTAGIKAVASINAYAAEIVWITLYNHDLIDLMNELFANDQRDVPCVKTIT